MPPRRPTHYRTYNSSLYDPKAGPGKLGYTNYNPPSIDAFVESLPSIQIPISLDLDNGSNVGGKHELSTMNPISQTRVASYIAFWDSLVDHPNFKAITFAVVEKILFQQGKSHEKPVAYGVQYSTVNNGVKQRNTACANKEVILSTGTLQTPQVLMLSVRISMIHTSL